MGICCVPNCRSRTDRKWSRMNIDTDGRKITFHNFPKEKERRLAWIRAIKRRGDKPYTLWSPTNDNYCVCSRHFVTTDFKRTGQRRHLNPTAVPSVFRKDLRTLSAAKANCSEAGTDVEIKMEDNQTFVSEEIETIQVLLPSGSELIEVCSCPENGGDGCKVHHRPSVIKQSMVEKEQSDQTYECTSSTGTKMLVINGNLSSGKSELNKLHDLKTSVHCTSETPNITNGIDLNKLSCVEKCDASTLVNTYVSDEKELKKEIANCKKLINHFQIKRGNMKNKRGRYRENIMKKKHCIFSELYKRKCLSSDPNFNMDDDGCLLDRRSIKICLSSDPESEED